MRVQRCKGTRDLTPAEMVRFRHIESTFRDCCLRWGYREVKTPTIEYLHLFTSAGTLTPGMLEKVYSFLDWDGWSGERVVLRPDGTIPIARLYIDSMRDQGLARLCYVTNTFAFEETGKKPRERWQCGTELIGANSPLADAELILLVLEILHRLNLEGAELRLSHAGLIKALLIRLGLSSEEQARILDRILDGDEEALAGLKTGKAELDSVLFPLLNVKGQSPGFLKNLKALSARSLPEFEPYLDNFISIVSILEAQGCGYRIDIASGGGFEYYTGIIFQFYLNGVKVAGGGRYDALIPAMGGGDIPASGFALYLDALMDLVKLAPQAQGTGEIIQVKAGSAVSWQDMLSAAGRLRHAGYVVELDLGAQRPPGLKWVLEVRSRQPRFALHDMANGSQREARDIDGVLALLEEGRSGRKNRPA
jgi:histidyl-tRNA synthetase